MLEVGARIVMVLRPASLERKEVWDLALLKISWKEITITTSYPLHKDFKIGIITKCLDTSFRIAALERSRL